MNPASPITPPRRRVWPWVLGLFLAPVFCLGALAFSLLTLDRDGAALRRQVMAASSADWHTKVQLSVGRITLGAVRTALAFVHHEDMRVARDAFNSVSCASVGVYERQSGNVAAGSSEKLIADTDEAMRRRGWCRLVGVLDKGTAVLVYVPEAHDARGAIDLCLAVLNERELVVVSATVTADGLARLIERQAGPELRKNLKLAKF